MQTIDRRGFIKMSAVTIGSMAVLLPTVSCNLKNKKEGKMVNKRLQVYKCGVCGNIVEVLFVGGGELVCCEQPMNLLEEKVEDQGNEKHLPVVEKNGDNVKVKVGSVPQPMEEDHHIQWIEVEADNGIHIKFIKAGEKPEAEFNISGDIVQVREYCNLHGLWKKE